MLPGSAGGMPEFNPLAPWTFWMQAAEAWKPGCRTCGASRGSLALVRVECQARRGRSLAPSHIRTRSCPSAEGPFLRERQSRGAASPRTRERVTMTVEVAISEFSCRFKLRAGTVCRYGYNAGMAERTRQHRAHLRLA